MFVFALATQGEAGMSPLEGGLSLLPMAVGFLITSIYGPRLQVRYGAGLIVRGWIIQAVGYAVLAVVALTLWPRREPVEAGRTHADRRLRLRPGHGPADGRSPQSGPAGPSRPRQRHPPHQPADLPGARSRNSRHGVPVAGRHLLGPGRRTSRSSPGNHRNLAADDAGHAPAARPVGRARSSLRESGGLVASGGVDLGLGEEQGAGQVSAAQVGVAEVGADQVRLAEIGVA